VVSQELQKYVDDQRAAGVQDAALRESMIASGWPVADVDGALKPKGLDDPLPLAPNPSVVPPKAEAQGEPKSLNLRSKRLMFLIGAAVVLLVIIGAAIAYIIVKRAAAPTFGG
jgi:hypothetical protein